MPYRVSQVDTLRNLQEISKATITRRPETIYEIWRQSSPSKPPAYVFNIPPPPKHVLHHSTNALGMEDRISGFVRCCIREAISRKNGRGESLPKFIGRTKVNRLILACINKMQRFRLGFCQFNPVDGVNIG